jgi:hypothetical protein
VAVGSGIGVGLGDVGSGTGGEPLFCGSGTLRRVKSAALSSVSIVEPDGPPGSRSRLAPAAGAGAAKPSSQVLAAVPQPTASMAVAAPCIRIATLPPVDAMPLAYTASAMEAKTPSSFATSTCPPGGTSGAPTAQAARRLTVAPVAET